MIFWNIRYVVYFGQTNLSSQIRFPIRMPTNWRLLPKYNLQISKLLLNVYKMDIILTHNTFKFR